MCRWTGLGILGQHQREHRPQVIFDPIGSLRVLFGMPLQNGEHAATSKGSPSGDELVEDDSGRVDVDSRRCLQRLDELGRHVLRCPYEAGQSRMGRSFDESGDAEIGDLGPQLRRGVIDQHVVGLDVAMHDALGVRHRQALEQIDTNLNRLFGSEAMTAPL